MRKPKGISPTDPRGFHDTATGLSPSPRSFSWEIDEHMILHDVAFIPRLASEA